MLQISDHILKQLNDDHREYLEKVENKLKENEGLLENTCSFVINRVGKDVTTDFKNIEKDNRLQACMDHLAISLVSGNVSKKEIDEVMADKKTK